MLHLCSLAGKLNQQIVQIAEPYLSTLCHRCTLIAKLCCDMAVLTVLMLSFMTGMRDLHDEDGS